MKRRHHTPEQIVRKLREADRMLGDGRPMVEVCKHLEVTEQTYYRWRNQYGGLKADDAKRLKALPNSFTATTPPGGIQRSVTSAHSTTS